VDGDAFSAAALKQQLLQLAATHKPLGLAFDWRSAQPPELA
jgi:hypothetical protein